MNMKQICTAIAITTTNIISSTDFSFKAWPHRQHHKNGDINQNFFLHVQHSTSEIENELNRTKNCTYQSLTIFSKTNNIAAVHKL